MTDQPNDPGGPQPEDASTPPPPPPDPAVEAEVAPPTPDEKNMALIGHLLGIVLSVLGPLIIWIIKKDESPFVDDQGKEAMNFQITMLIIAVGLMVLSCITFGIGSVLYLPWLVVLIIFCILAAVKAKDGVRYRYPFALRLIK